MSMLGRFGAVIILGAVSASAVACSSSSSTASTSPPTQGRSTTAAPTTVARQPGESDGAYVFRSQCAGCHGTKGEGNVGPPLAGIDKTLSVPEQTEIVRNGKARMPPFSPALSDADIAAVIEYTRTELK